MGLKLASEGRGRRCDTRTKMPLNAFPEHHKSIVFLLFHELITTRQSAVSILTKTITVHLRREIILCGGDFGVVADPALKFLFYSSAGRTPSLTKKMNISRTSLTWSSYLISLKIDVFFWS